MQTETTQRKLIWWGVNVLVLLYAFIPVVWILSLSLKDDATLNDGRYLPVSPSGDSYAAIFSNPDFLRALFNSIGICLIATLIAIVFGTMAAYAIARLTFPGKAAIVAVSLLISMFPQIALVTPLFKILTTHRAVRHLARPDHPLRHLRAAAGHLHALGVLPRDPVGPGEGGQDGRRHALPGVPPGDHPAGHAGHLHHGHPGLHLVLERLPVRAVADLDVERRAPCRRR